MEDTAQVWIFTGDGHGHFTHTFSIAAGAQPTGLNMVRNPITGNIDLLVGNAFGDVLRLQGNGNGTFQPPPDTRVGLSVTTFDGQTQVLIGNASGSHVQTETFLPGSDSFGPLKPVAAPATTPTTPFAPGDSQWYLLDQNSATPEAVVLDAGGNRMQTYRLENGRYVLTNDIPVGDDPVSVTIGTLPGNSAPDIFVANKGSNDVSVILGSYQNGQWVGSSGPRLKSSGSGPLATALVPDANSPGGNDLAITNQDGTVSLLPGRGQGFFNDTTTTTPVNLGTPITGVSLIGDAGFAVAQNGQVISFDIVAATSQTVFTPAAGVSVLAVEAVSASNFVVAETGGIVEDPELEETFRCRDGTPDTPCALQVLPTPGGDEVLVTSVGSDRVFVFTVFFPDATPPPVSSAQALAAQSFTGEANPGFGFTTTSIEEAPFAVVVTITADTLPGGSNGSSTAQFLQTTQPTPPGGDDGNLVAATDPPIAPGFVPAGDGIPGSGLDRRTDEPDFIRPLSRQRLLDAPWKTEHMLAMLAPDELPAESLNPAGLVPSGDRSRTNPIPAEVAVATLEARRAADLVWLGELPTSAPNHEGRERVPALAFASSPPPATTSPDRAPAAIASEEPRGRWVALLAMLPGVGLLWRLGDRPAEGGHGRGREDRRSWSLSKLRQLRPACRARKAGGEL